MTYTLNLPTVSLSGIKPYLMPAAKIFIFSVLSGERKWFRIRKGGINCLGINIWGQTEPFCNLEKVSEVF
jgi:hypothetical protein